MHSKALLSVGLLAVAALAAPARQHPLVHKGSPYDRDFENPYDKKVDTVGDDIQPLPVVSKRFHEAKVSQS